MLIAIIDVYPSENLFQRGKALQWLEKTLDHESVADADREEREEYNWWRAE